MQRVVRVGLNGEGRKRHLHVGETQSEKLDLLAWADVARRFGLPTDGGDVNRKVLAGFFLDRGAAAVGKQSRAPRMVAAALLPRSH